MIEPCINIVYLTGVNPAVSAVAQSGSGSSSPATGDGKQEKVHSNKYSFHF